MSTSVKNTILIFHLHPTQKPEKIKSIISECYWKDIQITHTKDYIYALIPNYTNLNTLLRNIQIEFKHTQSFFTTLTDLNEWIDLFVKTISD